MLVHKGGQINNVQLITGLRIAEMSQRQGEGGCVQRMEVIVKRKKKSGGQGGCELRSEAFVKIQKKHNFFFGGGGGRVGVVGLGGRVDVNGEVKLAKIKKIYIFYLGGGRVRGGEGWGGGGGSGWMGTEKCGLCENSKKKLRGSGGRVGGGGQG